MKRSPLNPMSAKRRAKLAAAGVARPFSTLASDAQPVRKPAMRAAAPIKRVRPVYTGPTSTTIARLEIRCGGFCEYPGCLNGAQDPHHRDERGMGGRGQKAPDWINKLANLLAACRDHNEWASNGSPDIARSMGWLLPSGEATPYNTPVLTRHHLAKVLLNDAGEWAPVGRVAT